MKALLALAMALAMASCSYTATFQSDPQGATVYIDGWPRGVTPCEIELPSRVPGYHLRMTKDGQAAERYVVPLNAAQLGRGETTTIVTGPTFVSVTPMGRGVYYAQPLGGSANTYDNEPDPEWQQHFYFKLRDGQ